MLTQHPILERLLQLESQTLSSGAGATPAPIAPAFAASGRFAADDLTLHVEGFGALKRPLDASAAERLRMLSQDARFGLREHTLLDPDVRRTGEIAADLLHLTWPEASRDALCREISALLGSGPLQARLHNLLVYGPGDFFKPHQDTEKHDGMVGTLVLVWPSAHLGGGLCVRHGSGDWRFASQQLGGVDLRWAAFFADCRHEVLPVQEGWRVVLTFDLVARPDERPLTGSVPADAGLVAALRAQCLPEHDDERQPDPWVLLLDHEYSERGLRWHLLKGADRDRVSRLRAAARALGLVLHLALVEVHETWSADFESSGWHRRRGEPDPEPEPGELIERIVTLDFWVDEHGQVVSREGLDVREGALASFVDTGEEHLVDEEYEGYMGNYGETLDYWYRRAALVVQTPRIAERNRFRVDPEGALVELCEMADDPARGAELEGLVRRQFDLLQQLVRGHGGVRLAPMAAVAGALADRELAASLLQTFDPASFLVDDVKPLSGLQQRLGAPWLRALWGRWASGVSPASTGQGSAGLRHWPSDTTSILRVWAAPLDEFTLAAQAAGLAPEVLDEMLGGWALQTLVAADARRAADTPAGRLSVRDAMLRACGELAAALRRLPDASEHLRRLLVHVVGLPTLYPTVTLAGLVETLGDVADVEPTSQPLRPLVVQALRQALARQARTTDDHSLEGIEWRCVCADCTAVQRWAASPTAQPLVLAIAEARRRHVVEEAGACAASLTSQTLKVGSPHKLQLFKPTDLHARARERRERWQRDLARLEKGGSGLAG